MTYYYGFHLLRGDQVCFMSSFIRGKVRHHHRRLKREGWRGNRWMIAPIPEVPSAEAEIFKRVKAA